MKFPSKIEAIIWHSLHLSKILVVWKLDETLLCVFIVDSVSLSSIFIQYLVVIGHSTAHKHGGDICEATCFLGVVGGRCIGGRRSVVCQSIFCMSGGRRLLDANLKVIFYCAEHWEIIIISTLFRYQGTLFFATRLLHLSVLNTGKLWSSNPNV